MHYALPFLHTYCQVRFHFASDWLFFLTNWAKRKIRNQHTTSYLLIRLELVFVKYLSEVRDHIFFIHKTVASLPSVKPSHGILFSPQKTWKKSYQLKFWTKEKEQRHLFICFFYKKRDDERKKVLLCPKFRAVLWIRIHIFWASRSISISQNCASGSFPFLIKVSSWLK